jgi:hypothetical protein
VDTDPRRKSSGAGARETPEARKTVVWPIPMLMQLSIPDELRGRVTGIVSLKAGLVPVGAVVAGVGADLVGPRAMTIVLSGIAAVIAVVVFCASLTSARIG